MSSYPMMNRRWFLKLLPAVPAALKAVALAASTVPVASIVAKPILRYASWEEKMAQYLIDEVFRPDPILEHLRRGGTKFPGGTNIEVPFEFDTD